MSVNSASETTLPSMPNLKDTVEMAKSYELGTNLIVGIVMTSFLIFVLLILALCKYRNRDEGTYTIDETKNCGPFAELDTPLNGSTQKSSNKKTTKNNRRKEISNKEWYV